MQLFLNYFSSKVIILESLSRVVRTVVTDSELFHVSYLQYSSQTEYFNTRTEEMLICQRYDPSLHPERVTPHLFTRTR